MTKKSLPYVRLTNYLGGIRIPEGVSPSIIFLLALDHKYPQSDAVDKTRIYLNQKKRQVHSLGTSFDDPRSRSLKVEKKIPIEDKPTTPNIVRDNITSGKK